MLIDQQEGEFPQNLNEEQIRQLQEMYGQEEYGEEGQEQMEYGDEEDEMDQGEDDEDDQ